MKYIKTKDGIYKVSHYNDWATHKRKGATLIDGYKNSYIKNENIIAQSETLEELCDMFVYCKSGFYEIYRQLDYTHYDKEYIKNGGTIKGAIWTDKGLIYVAKMNDKGELELI